ncbi:LuxR C-terminal-related transcriptional regulator [Enterobacter cloacae]
MIIKNIIVVTDNHYFSHGIQTLLSERDSVNFSVMTSAQICRATDDITGIAEHTLCIVDVNDYFYNILVYFDVMSILMDAKINLGSRLQILLCNNTSICLPSSDYYSLVSLVITGRGVNRLRRSVRKLTESEPVTNMTVKTGNTLAINTLTQTECEVLTALSLEQSVNDVAGKYQISPKCVSRHKCSGLKKMKKKRLHGVHGE